MPYAGFSPEFRVYARNNYTATGSETNVGGVITIPVAIEVESVIIKAGAILAPSVNYQRNSSTGYLELIGGTTAPGGTVFQIINLSTWHAVDTYSRTEVYTKAETLTQIGSKLADGNFVQMTGTAAARWSWVANNRDIIFVDTDIADGFVGAGVGGNIFIYSEDFTNANWTRGSNLPLPTKVTGPSGFTNACNFVSGGLTLSGIYQQVAISASTKYAVSALVRSISSSGTTGSWKIEWLDASSVVLSTTSITTDSVYTGAGAWQWVQQVATSPAGAVKANVYMPFGFASSAYNYQIAATQFEACIGDNAGPYFATTDSNVAVDAGFRGYQTAGIIQLPASPTVGDFVQVVDKGRKSTTNVIGVTIIGNHTGNVNGSYDDNVIALVGGSVTFLCATNGNWITPNF